MCGICGEVITERPGTPRRPDAALVARMCARLLHRGPDAQGLTVAGRAALGMRRLAIIDLPGSHQPLANEAGTVWVVFNGELYNYQALRQELLRRGHRFRTAGDTEVLVHLYEELGPRCVEPLRGMFAFALWDAPRERLVLARDRLGKKPLYYAPLPGRLLFASELKALLADPSLPRAIDPLALHHYLTLQYVPAPYSILAAVRKLPAAHRLVWEQGHTHLERYWELRYTPKLALPPEELQARTLALLREAVRLRTVADVPLGALLSGGVDSSAVVALLAEASPQPVKTFTVDFQEGPYSEAAYARTIARHVGAEHHELVVSPDTLLARLPAIIWHLDEPLADPAAVPLDALAGLARRAVTVALSGDGGDEVFGGYQRYVADPLADLLALLPRALRTRALAPLAHLAVTVPGRLPTPPWGGETHHASRITHHSSPGDRPLEHDLPAALARLVQAAELPGSASIVRWGSYFGEPMKAALYAAPLRAALAAGPPTDDCPGLHDQQGDHAGELAPSSFVHRPSSCGGRGARWPGATAALVAAGYHASAGAGRLDRTLAADTLTYLPDDLLAKTDRMSMAHSLEVRAPLLDHVLVEFVARAPEAAKVWGWQTKRLLRAALARAEAPVRPTENAAGRRAGVPAAVRRRGKQGFGVPLAGWLRGPLGPPARDLLLDATARRRGYFRPAAVERLLAEHLAGTHDHAKRLWALLCLELWHRQFLDQDCNGAHAGTDAAGPGSA